MREPEFALTSGKGVPGSYEFYWQCRIPGCRAVHWYDAKVCQRCGKQLARYNNPNYRSRKKKE